MKKRRKSLKGVVTITFVNRGGVKGNGGRPGVEILHLAHLSASHRAGKKVEKRTRFCWPSENWGGEKEKKTGAMPPLSLLSIRGRGKVKKL